VQPSLPFEVQDRERRVRGESHERGEPRARVEPRERGEPEFTRHPRAKRYVVRVRDDGSVHVTIPRWGSRREAKAFVDSQRAWVEAQRERAERTRQPLDRHLPEDMVAALRARALNELPPRLMQLAAAHGLTVRRVSIRNQKWRWGSCSRNGHICLNWRLVQMPDWVRDYVLIHELMHLRRLDHSTRFWALVATACPRQHEARGWLRANEHLLRR
jgi:predicted metal-dependent hydrolase